MAQSQGAALPRRQPPRAAGTSARAGGDRRIKHLARGLAHDGFADLALACGIGAQQRNGRTAG